MLDSHASNFALEEESVHKVESTLRRWSNTFITVGLLLSTGITLMMLSIALEKHTTTPPPPSYPAREILLGLLEKFGEALLVVGIVDCLLHLPLWKEYFLEQIKDSVTTDKYLSRLDDGELKKLLIRAFAARSKSPINALSRKGGFADFFFTDIKQYIDSPYRENVTCSLSLIEVRNDCFHISDRTTYNCRAAAGQIQDRVKWSNDEGEVDNVEVEVKHKVPGDTEWRKPFLVEKRSVPVLNPIDNEIPDACRTDGLLIAVNATYDVQPSRFQYWTMSHLSRNLTMVFSHPVNYQLQLTLFGLKDERATIERDTCSTTVTYLSWVLPGDGLAWKFSPAPTQPKA